MLEAILSGHSIAVSDSSDPVAALSSCPFLQVSVVQLRVECPYLGLQVEHYMVRAALFLEINRFDFCRRLVIAHADKFTRAISELPKYAETFYGKLWARWLWNRSNYRF